GYHLHLQSFPTRRSSDLAVMGCGNIGLLAIQWAKIFGAKKVYAIDIDTNKLKTAREVGADIVINSKEEPAYDQIITLTNGSGVRSEEHTSELQSRFDLVC